MRPALVLCVCLPSMLAGCFAPYRPAEVSLPGPLPARAYDSVLRVLREFYPTLALADREAFRLQSEWLPHQREDVPGERRATVYLDSLGQLCLLVEVRYFQIDLWGRPRVTPAQGDRDLEAELCQALESALR